MTMKHKIVKKKKAVKKKLGRPLGSKNKPKRKPSSIISGLLSNKWEEKMIKESSSREPLVFNQINRSMPASIINHTEESQRRMNMAGSSRLESLADARREMHSFPLMGRLNGAGVSGGESMCGNEERPMSHVEDALRYSTSFLERSRMDPYKFLRADAPNTALRVGDLPPAHYAHGKIQPWDVIKDWKLDYFSGNAMKYVCRHEHKGKPVEDLEKAIDCLQERVKILKAQGLK